MIPCQKCGKVNPMTTLFCHGCGQRLSLTLGQVANSVAATEVGKRDLAILASGRSAVTLCSFLLVCALVVRYVMVPELPPPDLPAAPDLPIIPSEAPAWAAGTTAAPAKIDFVPKDPLGWRAANAGAVLSSFSLPFAPLRDRQKAILASQNKDGSFPGGDDVCATALATLALQAWPSDGKVIAGAAKGRGWLEANWKVLGKRAALARTLAAMAMADAEAGADLRGRLGTLVVDGSSPTWQALALASTKPSERQQELAALRVKLTTAPWPQYLDAVSGQPGPIEARLLFEETAKGLTTGEQRLLWTTLAWLRPYAAKDLAATLKTWASAASAPVDAEFAKACGTTAADSVFLLTLTVPVRVNPFPLSR